jgi:hypothetical protein
MIHVKRIDARRPSTAQDILRDEILKWRKVIEFVGVKPE